MVNYDNRTLGRFPARKNLVTEGADMEDAPPQATPLLYLMDGKGNIRPANKSGFGWGGSGNYAYSITSPYADVPIQSNPVGYAYASIVSVWVSRCIEIRSQAVTRIPRYVVNRKTKDVIPGHPFEVAIKRAHKYGQNIYSLWERSKLIFGEVFLWPMQNDYRYVADIQWLNNLGTNPIIAAGYISGYTYVPVNGGKVHQFDYEDIAFYKTENLFNDLRGLSPLDTILLEIGIDKDVSRVTKAWYANDSRPGLILIPEADVGTESGKEFMDYWKENLQGSKNAGKPILLPRQIKEIKEFNRAPSPDDVQIRESMRREICARFGVPLSVAGAWDDAQYQSAPEQRRSLYEETIIPECEELDAWCTNALLPYFDDTGECEVVSDLTDIKALIEDESTKASISTQRLMSGGILLNEYRQAQGLPQDPNGNVYFVPSGVIVTPQANIGTPTPPPQQPQGFGGFQPPVQQSLVQQPPQALAKKSDDVLDELAAWKKKAMNGGAIKALSFVCYHLPKAIESEIRGSLRADMDRTALKAIFDHALEHVKKKSTDLVTATPEAIAEYWTDFDNLYSELGGEWLHGYMRKAFEQIKPLIRRGMTPDDVLSILDSMQDDLANEWVGTVDNPGAITALTLAGAAAGNRAIDTGKASNPVKAALTIDWKLINQQALDFARSYTYDLIRGLNDTTRNEVQNALALWVSSGDSLDSLERALTDIFSNASRAESIAQTESTRAYNAGAKQRWEQVGVKRAKWQTVRDGNVCPICSELHNEVYDIAQGAWSDVLNKYIEQPAHPRCRCFAKPVLDDVEPEPIVIPNAPKRARGVTPSNQFTFAPTGITQKLRAKLNEALSAIDKVHGIPEGLPEVPIRRTAGKKMVGGYASNALTNQPIGINISTASTADHQEFTLAHEIGHYLDHVAMRDENNKTWGTNNLVMGKPSPMDDWFETVKNTPEFQTLQDMAANPQKYKHIEGYYDYTPDRKFVNYLLSKKELWARAYSQYVATKSGNEAMLEGMKRLQPSPDKNWKAPVQWSDESFQPIAEAIDNLLQSLGWIE